MVVVEGPADVELVSVDRIYCRRGKVRSRVPKGAEGFVVSAPGSAVIDMGTEFAVNLTADGRTRGRVFEGEVEASVLSRLGTPGHSSIAVVTMLTLTSTLLMSTTRVMFGVSRDGLFWRRAGIVAENGTPRVALALTTFASIALVASGSVDRLIGMAGFFFVANYSWAYLSLIVLRRTRPDLARPFRVPAYPLPTLLVLLPSLAFLAAAVSSDRENSLWALALLAASFPIRLLLRAASRLNYKLR